VFLEIRNAEGDGKGRIIEEHNRGTIVIQ
jgi:hypothetical protein